MKNSKRQKENTWRASLHTTVLYIYLLCRFQCFFCFVNIERHTTRENSKYEKREFEGKMEAMEVPYYLDYAH